MTVLLVDTNVVVAGLLTADQASPTARVLDAMVAGAVPFLLSEDLLAEYRSVLLRPKVRGRHGLAAEEIDGILEQIAFHGIFRVPADVFDPPTDVGDRHLFALLAVEPESILVSGDRRTLAEAPQGRALTPRDAVERGLAGAARAR